MNNSSLRRAPRTPWFPANVNPVREGVYEIEPWPGYILYAYWNGLYWGCREMRIETAYEYRSGNAWGSVGQWRGLRRKA